MMFRVLLPLLALCALITTGCGPVYKTTYSYRPPKGLSGRDCIRNCEMGKELCVQRGRLDFERCQVDADRSYNDCLQHAKSDEDRRSCWRSSCSAPSEDACIPDYNRCFEVCGGRVIATTICVSNCPVE